ncbi:MAG: MBL fold metallo-hydrolase [Sphingomonadaceae bacterium]|nr:MBL fold metallo-hydrolase [Sphingomonadaceae bacterium]
MKVTILGCGTSSGVPRLGGPDGRGEWGACDPADPRNRRRRASILVEHEATTVVVDTGPDFRVQMLDAGVARLDAVLLTHDHADHAHGIDDLRQFFHAAGAAVPCYASEATWQVLERRFDYIFAGTAYYPPTATAHRLPAKLRLGGLTVTPFEQDHGSIVSTGFRFEADGRAFAYSTDVKALPLAAHPALKDLDLWIVDALRAKPHPTHSHLSQTLSWLDLFRPARAVLTHMDQSMDYATLAAELPAGVEPGYDGLTITL